MATVLRLLDAPTHWDTDALRAELARVMREGDAQERGAYAGMIRFELCMRGEPDDAISQASQRRAPR